MLRGDVILVLDNHDSFTWNLVQLLRSLGAEVRVCLSDASTAKAALAIPASHIVISPGPGTPEDAGCSLDVIRHTRVPLLGVCLGHQAVAAAFGGRVVRAPEPVHGSAAAISHDGRGLYAGLPPRFPAARYHSLVVPEDTLPPCLEPAAWSDGLLMGLRHRERPIEGVQFHPESVLTPDGPSLIRNFLGQTDR